METREQIRTVGVEEELLLVDVASGTPRAVANRVLRSARARGEETGDDGTPVVRSEPGGALETELQQQQVETDTEPVSCMGDLEAQLRQWRTRADAAARDAGVRVAAVGTFPGAVHPRPVPKARYLRMAEQFGLTTSEQLTCGCHVHVSVTSEEEAVAVVDRVRVWLPSLLALSANSPFWQGQDSGYASYRAQAWGRWPSAGPTDLFGSAAAYRRVVDEMLATGVLLDEGMLYFDARPSHRYPTVEIRVADVCLDAADTVLVAALSRALVETTAQQWAAGEPAPQVPTAMLRLASWQASRYGVDGDLLDPISCRPLPAAEVLAALVATVRPALEVTGDAALVDERLADVLRRGSGARRQREVLAKTGNLVDVVADAARVTVGQAD